MIARTIAGFVVAPIMPVIVLAVVILLAGGELETLSYAPFAAALSYPVTLVFGVPLFLVMRWRLWNGLKAYLLAGACLGVLLLAVAFALSSFGFGEEVRGWHNFLDELYFPLPFLVACAVASTAAFWGIVRPDQMVAK